ncbi:MAG: hypothetical protein JWM14_1180 [Chitinophagaceae bacterium]|nr:hypothetical protein [Chitinophagaceae bacterium]
MTNLKLKWKQAWLSPTFRIQWMATLLAGIALAISAPIFLNFIQTVHGVYIKDPLLNYLPPHDLSKYIFILLYTLLALSVIQLSFQPLLLLKALQAYILLTIMRGFCIYLFPLEPDKKIIPLVDPLIDNLFYQQTIITKDLFFSGHISTMTLLFLILPSSFTKKIAGVLTLVVALLILVQHVHYTIDVLAAPLAAWLAYYLVSLWPFSLPSFQPHEVSS